MPKMQDEKKAVSVALLAAAIKMRDILLQECHDKALLDPLEDDCNADFHINPTISVGEIKAFCEAVNDGLQRPKTR